MKRTLCTMALATLIFTSCEKQDVHAPESSTSNVTEVMAKKGSTPQLAVTTYGGQATGLNATITTMQNGTVSSNQTIMAQTALVPLSGGSFTASQPAATIAGVFSAASLDASVTAAGSQTTAHASASSVNVTVNGHVITATSITSTSTATCGTNTLSSHVQGLVINGVSIVVTGAPNQTVQLPIGGLVIINEQSTSRKPKDANSSVTGLHILVPNAADIRIAIARAEIKCA